MHTSFSSVSKDLVFIVSGGRTGTTFFGNALNNIIEDCYAVHEPDLMPDFRKSGIGKIVRRVRTFGLYHMVIGRLRGETGVRNLARKRLSNQHGGDSETIQQAIRKHRNFFYAGVTPSLVVESYSQWYGLLPEIRKVYPDAKVVAIIRDPRDWIKSWLNYEGHHDSRDMVLLAGQSRLSPAMIGDHEWADRWSKMSVFQKLCWDWKTIYGLIDDFTQRDDLTAVFRFEDLFDAGRPDMRRTFLDFVTTHGDRCYVYRDSNALFGQHINASSGKTADWTSWSTADARFLEQMCGDLMARYNYGTESAWRAKVNGVENTGGAP